MLERIILPLDGSALAETALPHAAAVAEATGANLVVLRVIEPQNRAVREGVTDPLNWQILKAEAESYLEGIAGRFDKVDVGVETLLLEGDPAERIIEATRRQEAGLVILSSHGESGLSGWNVSSVVQKIILRIHTSIMIVRAYRPPALEVGELQYKRILVPLDGSRRAEVVLPYVRALAEAQEAETLVVNIVGRPEMPRRAPLSSEDAALADRIVERNRAEAEKYIEEIRGRLGEKSEMRLLVGDSVILRLHEFVEEESVDLVLFSAHGYTGNAARPYGSLVTSFIAYGRRPMLIIQDVPREKLQANDEESIVARDEVDNMEPGPRVVHARTSE